MNEGRFKINELVCRPCDRHAGNGLVRHLHKVFLGDDTIPVQAADSGLAPSDQPKPALHTRFMSDANPTFAAATLFPHFRFP